MGVTCTIQDNRDYCKANKLSGKRTYDCQYCNSDPNCRECKGEGKVHFEDYPFELCVSYGTMFTLLAWLGKPAKPDDYCGEIDPADIILKHDEDVYYNLPLPRGADYLLGIAQEAERRQKKIYWV